MKKNLPPLIVLSSMLVIVAVLFCFLKPEDSELNFVGTMDYCKSHDCIRNYIQTIETYDNSDSVYVVPKGERVEGIYGGRFFAQVCTWQDDGGGISKVEQTNPCQNLNLTQLTDYKIENFENGHSGPNYSYLGMGVYSQYRNTAYFLYTYNNPSSPDAEFVYELPHVVIAYNFTDKSVKKVGKIDLYDLGAHDLLVSPHGENLILVNKSSGIFWLGHEHNGNIFGITSLNVKTGKTARLLAFKEYGSFYFVDWINDNEFLYKIGDDGKNGRVIFKTAKIPL